MGLKNIHVVFISMAIVLALAIGSWGLSMYGDVGGLGYLAFAVLSFASAIGLAVYGSWFLRKTKDLGS